MLKKTDQPDIYCFPANIPFSKSREMHLEIAKKALNEKLPDAIIVISYISGKVNSELVELLRYISFECANKPPVFIVRDALHEQIWPPKDCQFENLEPLGAIYLQSAYSSIIEEVVSKIIQIIKENDDPGQIGKIAKKTFEQSSNFFPRGNNYTKKF